MCCILSGCRRRRCARLECFGELVPRLWAPRPRPWHFSEMFLASKRVLLNLILEEQSTALEVIRGCDSKSMLVALQRRAHGVKSGEFSERVQVPRVLRDAPSL